MPRIKEKKVIVTFPTTTQAMHMEACCRSGGENGRNVSIPGDSMERGKNVPGRLIPVPREISAGCGMAWCSPVALRGAVEEILEESGIEAEGIYELLL